jgi:UPF0755 protein
MSKKGKKNTFVAMLLVLLLIGGVALYLFYRAFYYPGIRIPEKSRLVYIHTGWNFEQVMDMLESKDILKNPKAFKLLAGIKKYKTNIKPGRYRILNGMNNVQLVNLLLSGKQEPESISIHNMRTIQDLAGILALKMEADSTTIINAITDRQTLKKYGFNIASVSAMFIPGTYSLLWTDKPNEFIERMHDNYESFWTDERRQLAAGIPLTPIQVSILASIVQAEQSIYDSEKPVIAGLYINRLKKDMPLQSDPTLVFARGDFSILRVRNGDKKVESQYNTYEHTGLPPGPINMPEPSSIDAVLHYQKSDYLYMCAEADFSGRHHFTNSFKDQEQCAMKYRKALNQRGIIR